MTATLNTAAAGPELRDLIPDLDPRIHLLNLVCWFEDGRIFEGIRADQRDMRRALAAIGTQDPTVDELGFLRANAWAALNRVGVIEMGWNTFDAQVIAVQSEETPTTVVDPTPAAPDA